MRGVLAVVAVIGALLALTLSTASAAVPIAVNTDLDRAGWEDGVYVQEQMIPGETRGDWIVVGCLVHVQTLEGTVGETEYETVGETMEASDGVTSYFAPVNGIYMGGREAVAGRATFQIGPGVSITTTNTDVPVSASCPGGQPAE